MKRKLLISLIGIVVLLPLGLCSRHVNFLPDETGDALWAMMVFCLWRILLVRRELRVVAIVSIIHSFLVEFSQLVRLPPLVSFRGTFIGDKVYTVSDTVVKEFSMADETLLRTVQYSEQGNLPDVTVADYGDDLVYNGAIVPER